MERKYRLLYFPALLIFVFVLISCPSPSGPGGGSGSSNDPPYPVTGPVSSLVTEGDTFNLTITSGYDPDGDTVTFSASLVSFSGPGSFVPDLNITGSAVANVISPTDPPGFDWAVDFAGQTAEFLITTTDEHGAETDSTINIEVLMF